MTQKIYVRQFVEDDWQAYRSIRLEALQKNQSVFGMSFEVESQKDEAYWRRSTSYNGTVFGLYDADELIGLTGIYRDWNGREGVAILCMSYIREEYRGKGLSEFLYKARIDWAKSQGDINLLVVGHRDGNAASRGANQKWKFVFSHIKDQVYGDGQSAKDYVYELKI